MVDNWLWGFMLLVVYRSPSGTVDLGLFIDFLELHCEGRCRDRTHWLIGDINCCILDDNGSIVTEHYLDVLYRAGFVSCGGTCQAFTQRCIDHVFCDVTQTCNIKSFIIIQKKCGRILEKSLGEIIKLRHSL